MSSQTTRQVRVPSFSVQAGPPTFTPPSTPRHIPFWPVAAALVLLLLAGSVFVGWRMLAGSEPRAAATPQPVVAPVAPAAPVAGSRPQEDAPVVLDALPLAEYRLPAPHLSAGHEPRVSPRPPSGAWWANRRYE